MEKWEGYQLSLLLFCYSKVIDVVGETGLSLFGVNVLCLKKTRGLLAKVTKTSPYSRDVLGLQAHIPWVHGEL